MATGFLFSGGFTYDGEGANDPETLARRIRQKYGGDVALFLQEWNVAGDLTVEVGGEIVFSPSPERERAGWL